MQDQEIATTLLGISSAVVDLGAKLDGLCIQFDPGAGVVCEVPPARSGAVIVYGGERSGKTFHCDALARALGCTSICDEGSNVRVEWDGVSRALEPGCLYLVPRQPAALTGFPDDVLIIPIETALAVAISAGLI